MSMLTPIVKTIERELERVLSMDPDILGDYLNEHANNPMVSSRLRHLTNGLVELVGTAQAVDYDTVQVLLEKEIVFNIREQFPHIIFYLVLTNLVDARGGPFADWNQELLLSNSKLGRREFQEDLLKFLRTSTMRNLPPGPTSNKWTVDRQVRALSTFNRHEVVFKRAKELIRQGKSRKEITNLLELSTEEHWSVEIFNLSTSPKDTAYALTAHANACESSYLQKKFVEVRRRFPSIDKRLLLIDYRLHGPVLERYYVNMGVQKQVETLRFRPPTNDELSHFHKNVRIRG